MFLRRGGGREEVETGRVAPSVAIVADRRNKYVKIFILLTAYHSLLSTYFAPSLSFFRLEQKRD